MDISEEDDSAYGAPEKIRRQDSTRSAVSESEEETDSDEEELPDFIMDYASSGKDINFGESLVKKLVLSSIFGLPLCDRSRKEWLDVQKERITNFWDLIFLDL